MKLLCTGDLHAGKGPQTLAEQERVWVRCVELAHEHECSGILFAGDAVEGPLPTPEHYAAFARPLATSLIPIVAITGNGRHDAAKRDISALEVLSAPRFQVHRRPAVVKIVDGQEANLATPGGLVIACLPWVEISHLVASRNGGDRDQIAQDAVDLLLETARGLRDQTDGPAVLLTHFPISGDADGISQFERGPVLPLTDLAALGFDAVIAGHYHRPQLLHADPPVLYVGSPLALSHSEEHEHGCWLLEIDKSGPAPTSAETVGVMSAVRGGDAVGTALASGGARPTFLPIEATRFVTLETMAHDIITGAFPGSLVPATGLLEDAFVRVRYSVTAEQARRIDQQRLREALMDAGALRVKFEAPIEHEARARIEALTDEVTDVDAFELWLAAESIDDDRAAALRELHTTYMEKAA